MSDKMADEKYRLSTLEELEESPQRVTINEKKYLVCKVDEEVYAFRNVCPHQHGPIAEGKIDCENNTVLCPWHGWEFDLDGGTSVVDNGIGDTLPQAKTQVEDGDVYLVG